MLRDVLPPQHDLSNTPNPELLHIGLADLVQMDGLEIRQGRFPVFGKAGDSDFNSSVQMRHIESWARRILVTSVVS